MTVEGTLLKVKLDEPASISALGTVATPKEQAFTDLLLSADGTLAVLYQSAGQNGVVIELESLRNLKELRRDGYYSSISPFPVAFLVHEQRILLVHSPLWNRLEVCDPRTGEPLTPRDIPKGKRGEPGREHYLDYFHGRLAVSPDQNWIAEDGWIWHPVGAVTAWSVTAWLETNVWESEDVTFSP